MLITAKENFDNFIPINVCIMNTDYLAVVSVEECDSDGEPFVESRDARFRISTYNMSLEGLRWAPITYKQHSWRDPMLVHTVLDELIITDDKGWVYYKGVGKNKGYEDDLPSQIALIDIKNINGRIFGTTGRRRLVVRNGPNDWEVNEDMFEEENGNQGFWALDGFSEDEVYLVGKDRDIWRYNHTKREWYGIDVGVYERARCESVCCAEDGNVYIGCADSMLIWGRGDYWQHKELAISGQTIKSIVSFQGKVFLGTTNTTYVLDDNFVAQPFDFDGQLFFAGGHLMYAAHGMMIVANYHSQVALYDGNKWVNLHGCQEMTADDIQILDELNDIDAENLLKNLQDLNKSLKD